MSSTVVSSTSVVLLRVMISLIFIVASINHLFNTDKVIARIDQAKFGAIGHLFGDPYYAVVLSGVIMIIGGISLAIGYKVKWASLVLIMTLIPITLTIQVGQLATIGPLFKNVAILGGLLFFFINENHRNK